MNGPNWFEHDLRNTRRPAPKQDGWKEHLLCHACEQRISRWEKAVCEELGGRRYASAWWRIVPYGGPIIVPMASRPVIRVLEVRNGDYATWRLFMVSLLWKMGKSRLPEFAAVDLDADEGIIRRMILQGELGKSMDYPCWIYILSANGRPLKGYEYAPSDGVHGISHSRAGVRRIGLDFCGGARRSIWHDAKARLELRGNHATHGKGRIERALADGWPEAN